MKIKVLNTETQVEIHEMNLDDWIDQTGECSLGRSPHSGLVLDSPDVSRLHAKLAFESGHYYFYDLGSSNGSMINGRVVDPQQKQLLKPGDIIRVGEFMLTLYPLNDQSERLPATVIGGSEMTVCGQLHFPESIDTHPSPEAEVSMSQPEQQLEQPEPETPPQIEEPSTLETPMRIPTQSSLSTDDELVDDEVENQTNDKFDDANDHFSASQTSEPSLDAAPVERPESNFTVIQLEPSVDLSQPSIDDASDAVMDVRSEVEAVEQLSSEALEKITGSLISDRFSVETLPMSPVSTEEPTFIQADQPLEPEVDISEPLHQLDRDLDETLDDTGELQPLSNFVETALEPAETDEDLKLSIQQCEDSEINETDELEQEAELELEADIATNSGDALLTETLNEVINETNIPDANPGDEVAVAEELEVEILDDSDSASSDDAVDEVDDRVNDSNAITPDTRVPAPLKHQPILSEKYVALLAHDSQAAALVELVASHKSFLMDCSTIATPSIHEMLKQQTEFEVTQQTPSIPIGGYQTINRLITADKIAAVIFLRDFLNAQVNQANDEAFSRSCNIHQVLFASNLSTADALLHYLQVMSKQT
jgi:methylglyoxal synthase